MASVPQHIFSGSTTCFPSGYGQDCWVVSRWFLVRHDPKILWQLYFDVLDHCSAGISIVVHIVVLLQEEDDFLVF